MTKKRRIFDIDLPVGEGADLPPDLEIKSVGMPRRGPLATAIGGNSETLQRRALAEADIRAENDALAHEFVRLKKVGLIVDMVPVDAIDTGRLTRDRARRVDLSLDDLKTSIRDIGLSNPIRVVATGEGRIELVQGHRRLTAYRELLTETGDDFYCTIPAGLIAAGDTAETL